MTIIFAVELNWLPAIGIGPDGLSLSWVDLSHIVLPVLTLALIPMGIVTRTVRGKVIELMGMEFISGASGEGPATPGHPPCTSSRMPRPASWQ